MSDIVRPFRWDIARREQLGSLPQTELPELPPRFADDLVAASARVIAFAGDSDLIFVGRSPDALFHFLSGALLDTTWAERLRPLTIALRRQWIPAEAGRALRPYLDDLELSPSKLLRRIRPAAFVDVVDTGGTFGDLVSILHVWTEEAGVEWRAVARKIRLVGVTWREKTSPKTWRWQQHAHWARLLPRAAIKNVSAPRDFMTYLAADQPKTTEPFAPADWWNEAVTRPLRTAEARTGLALALHLFDLGRRREGRLLLASELVQQPAMRETWFRSLVLEIKR